MDAETKEQTEEWVESWTPIFGLAKTVATKINYFVSSLILIDYLILPCQFYHRTC